MSEFLDRTQRLIPDQRVLAVCEGQVGVNPAVWWLPGGEYVTMFNAHRVVAVTDRSIVVLEAGRLRWNWTKPSRVLFTLPRNTPIPPATDDWNKVLLGPEWIWIARRGIGFLERAQMWVPAPPAPVTAAEPAPLMVAEPAQ